MGRWGRFTDEEVQAFLARLVEVAPPSHARGKVKGPCRVYTGARTSDGYSNVWIGGRNVPGHILMWEIVTGRPPRQLLLHACDNRACANFDHLSDDSARANYDDMARKGRDVPPPHPTCESHPSSKLDTASVRKAMARLERGEATQQQIAAELGIAQSRVSEIFNGKGWRCR